jgi:hypothetical protein
MYVCVCTKFFFEFVQSIIVAVIAKQRQMFTDSLLSNSGWINVPFP